MKTVPVESTGPTLRTLLPKISDNEAVFLTVEGEVRFVVLPVDEGDREVLAMRGNRPLMNFLDRCGQRARTGPRRSLKDIRSEEKKPRPPSALGRKNGKGHATRGKK